MTDYIEREAALNFIANVECRPSELEAVKNALQVYSDHISSLPAADVQPVVPGKWLSREYMYGAPDAWTESKWVARPAKQSDCYAYCSECRKGAGYDADLSVILSKFCPNCGARMDLEDTE